jgi:putative membrane protein
MSEQRVSTPPVEDAALRDQLAVYRTVMANERTLLSYTRTALAMVVVGATLLEFVEQVAFRILGLLAILLGAGLMAVGLARFRSMQRRIAPARSDAPRGDAPTSGG